jgi:hypothetical protein
MIFELYITFGMTFISEEQVYIQRLTNDTYRDIASFYTLPGWQCHSVFYGEPSADINTFHRYDTILDIFSNSVDRSLIQK